MVVSVSFRGASDSYSGIIGAESQSVEHLVNTNHQHFTYGQLLFLAGREILHASIVSVILTTLLISHRPCPDTKGAAVAVSLHQPSTPPCGIYTIYTCPTPPPVSIYLSVFITPFQPLHPSQPEWDNGNRRWRGIWREASLLYSSQPRYFSIPAIKFVEIQRMVEERRFGEKVNVKSLLVLTDGRILIVQRGHVTPQFLSC